MKLVHFVISWSGSQCTIRGTSDFEGCLRIFLDINVSAISGVQLLFMYIGAGFPGTSVIDLVAIMVRNSTIIGPFLSILFRPKQFIRCSKLSVCPHIRP